VWSVVDGSPTTTPTVLAGALVYTEARGFTDPSWLGTTTGGGAPPGGDSTAVSFAQFLFENNVNDGSGNGNNLTGAPDSYETTTVYQGTYSAKYESTTSSTISGALFGTTDVYVAFAFHNPSTETDRTRHYILQLGDATDGLTIEYDGNNGDLEVHRYVSSTDYEVRTANGDITEDAWHTIIVQFSGTTCNIYVNGTLENSGGSTLTGGFYNTGTASIGYALESFIDNLQFGNDVLTSAERDHYDSHPNWLIKRED
jgi:hypothetical protein